jgi:hypothetical protein
MFTVINSRKTPRGLTTCNVMHPDGRAEEIQYTQIFGGLSWPNGEAPAHHCFLGELFSGMAAARKPARGKIILLAEAEHSGISLDRSFSMLTDDAMRVGCKRILTNKDEALIDFATAFQDWCYDKGNYTGYLEQAPYATDFNVGIGITQDFFKEGRVDLPSKSLIYSQLHKISRQDLGEAPEKRFYAVNSFRYAISGFHKFKPSMQFGRRRRRCSPKVA